MFKKFSKMLRFPHCKNNVYCTNLILSLLIPLLPCLPILPIPPVLRLFFIPLLLLFLPLAVTPILPARGFCGFLVVALSIKIVEMWWKL